MSSGKRLRDSYVFCRKVTPRKDRTQAFAPRISVAARNVSLSVYTLLIKEVANTHTECIRDLMKTTDRYITSSVYYIIDRLSGHPQSASQFGITHVFFIITLRRFNCDSYFTFFIAAYFKTVYTNSPTTIIGSEAMIVYLFVQELTGLFRYNRRSLCYERIISATRRSLSRTLPDHRMIPT